MPRRFPRTWPRKTWTCHHGFMAGAEIHRNAVDHWFETCVDTGRPIEIKRYLKHTTLVNGVLEDFTYLVAIHPDHKAPIYVRLTAVFGQRVEIMYGKYVIMHGVVTLDFDDVYQDWWDNGPYHAWCDQYDVFR